MKFGLLDGTLFLSAYDSLEIKYRMAKIMRLRDI